MVYRGLRLRKPLFLPFLLLSPLLAAPFSSVHVFPCLLRSVGHVFNIFSLLKVHKGCKDANLKFMPQKESIKCFYPTKQTKKTHLKIILLEIKDA